MILRDGDDVRLSGTTIESDPSLAGTVVEDALLAFGDAENVTFGMLQSRVLRSGAGTLDFGFRILELGGLTLERASWTLVGITDTDVDFRLDGAGEAVPAGARRRDVTPVTGGERAVTLEISFHGSLSPGRTSKFVYVRTDALHYETHDGLVLHGESRPDGSAAWSTVVSGSFGPAPA